MVIIDAANVENAKTPPTYTIVSSEQPPADFTSQNAFYAKESDGIGKATEELNRGSESLAEGNQDDADADAEDSDNTEEAVVKKSITKKAQLEHLKKRKNELINAAGQIYIFGLQCKVEINQQAFNAAIPGLAMILGTYRAYFDDADDQECKEFTKILIQRCNVDLGKKCLSKNDKRTTPFHLLSRLFRNSERRQASADAKILKLAHKEAATQESFESWVKEYGSLSAILRKTRDEDAGTEEKPSGKNSKPRPFFNWVKAAEIPENDAEAALAALEKLADGKKYTTSVWHHHGRFDIMRLVEQPTGTATGAKNEESE